MLVEFLSVEEGLHMSRLVSSATAALILATVMAATTSAIRASERISIRVSPGVAYAPVDLTINAEVEPNAANRTIEVIADSDEFFRRSESELEGERAPRTNQFRFSSLPAGVYRIRVAVKGASDRELGSAKTEITVLGDR